MNKFFISIAFAAIFATAGLAVAGDKPDPPGAKKSLQRIRLPFDCDGKRDGVVMDSQVITRDPDNVKLGTKFDLTTTITGLDRGMMRGRCLAVQILKRILDDLPDHDVGMNKYKWKVHTIVWIPEKDIEWGQKAIEIKYPFTFNELGMWYAETGLAYTQKYEWWDMGGTFCIVK
jgi:hypothetical protein